MTGPLGFFSPGDTASLRHLLRRVPIGGLVYGVGTYRGKAICSSAEVILQRQIRVVGIDLFDWSLPSHQEEAGDVYDDAVASIDRAGLSHCVELKRTDSVSGAQATGDGTADGVFIDADHRFEYVLADIYAWWPKLKQGGWIGGHDFVAAPTEPPHLEVVAAVHRAFGFQGAGKATKGGRNTVWAAVRDGRELMPRPQWVDHVIYGTNGWGQYEDQGLILK